MTVRSSVLSIEWHQRIFSISDAERIMHTYNLDMILSTLLAIRNIPFETIQEFLKPDVNYHLPDPFHLLDMHTGTDRVISAIKNNEKIYLFADYDADGACSAALLYRFLKDANYHSEIYIPDRILEGYGPTDYVFKYIKNKGADLVILLDCGSSSNAAIASARDLDIDVIVIDHHISTETLPNAVAIINPNRIDQESSYGHLSAAGVTFLFCMALRNKMRKIGYFAKIQEPLLIKYLDLVAISTVCDVVSLTGINRAFVHYGIKLIRERRNIGIAALCDVANIQEQINSYHLGFILGPRINAGGRVGLACTGAHLLISDSQKDAYTFASRLEEYNSRRISLELQIESEAMEAASLQSNESVIVVTGEWHIGIIGIVASRIKEAFNRPSIIISTSGGIGRGSCRSIEKVDIGNVIVNAYLEGILLSGGGHKSAAGLSIDLNMIEKFTKYVRKNLASQVAESVSNSQLMYYDIAIDSSAISNETMSFVELFEPFGTDNKMIVFRINSFVVKRVKPTTCGKHLTMTLESIFSRKYYSAVSFKPSSQLREYLLNSSGKSIDVICNMQRNFFQAGVMNMQFIIKDVIPYDNTKY